MCLGLLYIETDTLSEIMFTSQALVVIIVDMYHILLFVMIISVE